MDTMLQNREQQLLDNVCVHHSGSGKPRGVYPQVYETASDFTGNSFIGVENNRQ